MRCVVVETGDRQPAALALYRRARFSPIKRFGEYGDSQLSVCTAEELE